MKRFLPNRKGVLALLLVLFAGLGTAYAYSFSAVCPTGQTLYYYITDATNHYVEITYPGTSLSNPWEGYTQPTGNITLPSSVSYNGVTYAVKAIGYAAFYDCSGLTGSLTIPNSVTEVSSWAFTSCSGFTGSLSIPSSVTTIGKAAFGNCGGFTGSLTIPNSVTSIGNNAFMDCSGFTGSLTIPNSVTTIGEYAFAWCTGFTGTLTIPNSVIMIGSHAFRECGGFTGTLTIPNSVTTIGNYAFCDCYGFTGNLVIPNSVTEIGENAFNNCSGFTGTLTLPNSLTSIGEYAFAWCTGFTGTLTIPNSMTTIGNYAFAICSGFTGSLTIPNSVTSIGEYAFAWCTGFSGSLALGNSVTSIGNTAFYQCTGFIGSLTIPNSVTSIGEFAFAECSDFTGALTIGRGVTSIGQSAFNNCTGFTQVNYNAVNCADVTSSDKPFETCGGTLTIGSMVQRIPAYMFYGCSGFTGSLYIPNSVTTIGNEAFRNCGFTGTLTLPSSLTTISYGAFYNCSGFTGSLTLPSSLTTISGDVFYNCSGFTGTLTLPSTVTSIGSYAFWHCSGFTGTLTIPNSVTSIGDYAFYGCSGFTQVLYNAVNCADMTSSPFKGCQGTLIIGSAVERIPAEMFSTCSGFTGSLSIPNSVTSIGDYAFYGCTGFNGSLTLPNSVTTIGNYAFSNCNHFTGSLTIPNSVTSINNGAFYKCTGFTGSLIIGNSVTSIGQNAFYQCNGLTGSLTIPNSVTTIGNYAFYSCSHFTGSLTIPNSVTTIGQNAFYYCTGFTGLLTIGSSVTTIGSAAFSYCSNLIAMTVLPETPPTLGTNVFLNVPTTIPVYVPCSSLEDYQAAPGWSAFTNIQCRQTLTLYDGTATNDRIPAYIYYFDNFTRSQFVIPADDLADMTGTPISSMTFYTTNQYVPYTTVSSADVYLKEVSYTTISAYEPKSSATTVYSGYFDIVSAGNGGKMTINFSTPYTYNGGNLLIGIENTEDNEWRGISFYGQTVSGASISGMNSSSTGTIPATQQNFIPKTTFGYTPSDCSRPIALTTTGITSNSAMLNWTGVQDEYDIRYRTKPLFFEDFEHGLPSGWTTIDNDGDGYNWALANYGSPYSHSGTGLMYSQSWTHSVGALTPDNWLVTPQLALQGTMKVWLRAFDPVYLDQFAIYLSTTGNGVSDFTTVLVPETTATEEYVCYTADLSAYAGQQGYIAIRHNCTDMDELFMDDFGIFNNPDGTEEWETLYDIGSSYTLGTLEPATEYEWQVRGRDCDGSGTLTEWSTTCSFTTHCEALIVDGGNPFTEDFEGADFAPACWENIPSGSYQWSSSTNQSHSSSHSAYSRFYGDIYLVLPDIELSAYTSSAQLSFWSYNTYPSDFEEGYNTVVLLNGGTETVLWSAETVSQEWVETIVDLTDYLGQTVSLAFKYAGYNGNGWYIDDVEVSVTASISLAGGDWHLIASPLESVSPDDIPGMTSGDYDLYRFEPSATDEEWQNYKGTTFSLESGKGYLYAHGTDVTLVFDGTSYTVTEPVEVPLVYDANDSHKCWNLVGNPYHCEAYLNKECYMLNAEGTGINPEPQPIGTPIPPYTAVFVKAVAVGDTVVFTKTIP